MKKFDKFLEEVSIKGNQGVPGETRGENDQYLNDRERAAKQRLGVSGREAGTRAEMEIGMEIMQLLQRSLGMTRGKETELNQLAEEVIRANYDSILDGVELDIKLVTPREVKQNMDDDEEEEEPDMPSYQLLNDPEIRKEVDKRKLANNIIQGEAKNSKFLLHTDEVKDGITRIFGDARGREIFTIWDRISRLAEKMDWIVPIEIKSQMIEEHPEGLAGSVKVDWKPKEIKEKKEKEEEDPNDLAARILKDIEEGNTIDDNEDDIADLFDDATPVIRARGVDFPMLLHETIKGIYELIAAAAIPEDKRTAEVVKLNTSSALDEAEDFKYGPEIASDLRDFVNQCRDIDKYPNLREHIFGDLMRMPVDTFLPLFKGILRKSPEARVKIDELMAKKIAELDKFELGEVLGHEDEEKPVKNISSPLNNQDDDYSSWSNVELRRAIDNALDDGDYALVDKLQKFIKESYNESIKPKKYRRIDNQKNKK